MWRITGSAPGLLRNRPHRCAGSTLRERLAGLKGISYFSVFDLLCDPTGCLTTINGQPDGLTAYDYSHMLTVAAIYVAQAMLKDTAL